jgi:holliday junction DNA helicase RuvA
MIAAIEGIIESKETDSVIVKTGALSLVVHVPGSTLNKVGKPGESIYLHTHLHLREDNISLFGFYSRGELQIFEKLISVSGVGPRIGLAILTALEPQELVAGILGNNTDLICSAPGVGKKLAARIILELKGKLEKEGLYEFGPIMDADKNAEVLEGLVNLGYSAREAAQAVSSLPSGSKLTLEQKITLALRHLANK